MYIKKEELRIIEQNYQKNKRELARKLMIQIVGEEILKTMTPTGKGNKECIPKPVYLAVFGMHIYT